MAALTDLAKAELLCGLSMNDIGDWGSTFSRSLYSQLAKGKALSEKQAEKLDELYDRHFVDTED